jgi:hypothetical protein
MISASTATVLLVTPVVAQWRNLPTDTVPRGADGKPNLAAPTELIREQWT